MNNTHILVIEYTTQITPLVIIGSKADMEDYYNIARGDKITLYEIQVVTGVCREIKSRYDLKFKEIFNKLGGNIKC